MFHWVDIWLRGLGWMMHLQLANTSNDHIKVVARTRNHRSWPFSIDASQSPTIKFKVRTQRAIVLR